MSWTAWFLGRWPKKTKRAHRNPGDGRRLGIQTGLGHPGERVDLEQSHPISIRAVAHYEVGTREISAPERRVRREG